MGGTTLLLIRKENPTVEGRSRGRNNGEGWEESAHSIEKERSSIFPQSLKNDCIGGRKGSTQPWKEVERGEPFESFEQAFHSNKRGSFL